MMNPAIWTALSLWAIVVILAVVAIFLIKLLLRFERAASHLDFTLSQLDRTLPPLMEQSQKTLQSLELTSGRARSMIDKIEEPMNKLSSSAAGKSLLSPEIIAAIIGLLKGFNFFKRIIGTRGQVERQVKK